MISRLLSTTTTAHAATASTKSTPSSSSSSSSSPPSNILWNAFTDITGGTVGGVGIVIVGHPFDTMKIRLQTQDHANPRYRGLSDCVSQTYRHEGLGGFYKGFASPLYGQMFFNAAQFLAYGKAKEFAQRIIPSAPSHSHSLSYSTSSSPSDVHPLTVPQAFLAGAITGAFVAFVESPIDLMKTQMQTQIFKKEPLFTTFFGTVRYISGTFGLRGVYQGIAPTIVRNIPAVSFYFGVYEWSRQKLKGPNESIDSLPSWKLLAAGALGGLGYWSTVYPIDVVKSSIQSDAPKVSDRKYHGSMDAVRKLYAAGGISRFFVGISPCLLRAAPANAVCFMLYQKTVEFMGK